MLQTLVGEFERRPRRRHRACHGAASERSRSSAAAVRHHHRTHPLAGSSALNVMPGRARVSATAGCCPAWGADLEAELRAALGDDIPYELEFLEPPPGGTVAPIEYAARSRSASGSSKRTTPARSCCRSSPRVHRLPLHARAVRHRRLWLLAFAAHPGRGATTAVPTTATSASTGTTWATPRGSTSRRAARSARSAEPIAGSSPTWSTAARESPSRSRAGPRWPARAGRLDLRPDGNLRREREELLAVAAREVRDRAQHALAPEELVGKRGDVAHVDAAADDGAALRDGAQRGGTSSPAGAKMIAASSSSGGGSAERRPTRRRARARSACAAASPGRVNAKTRRPWWRATCATMCAAAPKP